MFEFKVLLILQFEISKNTFLLFKILLNVHPLNIKTNKKL